MFSNRLDKLTNADIPTGTPRSNRSFAERAPRFVVQACLSALLIVSTGCTALLTPVSGVPARRLPSQFMAKPKNDLVPVDIYRLRQDPPRAYLIDAGDILGVWIQGVLGSEDETLPFQMPDAESDLPPSIGYPVVVREDGSISLPFIPPIMVRGLTIGQVEQAIRKAYTVDYKILLPGKDRIIVTIMKERTYKVIVLRQDGIQGGGMGGGQSGFEIAPQTVDLPAYQNDVLHALSKTGGLPGLDAKNEIKILKGKLVDAQRRDQFVREFYNRAPCDPCLCPPPLPGDPSVVTIPLRLPVGQAPAFGPSDIILADGDIVMIEGREREVYYTGGMLGGGEHPLPRDYDLDVVTAMARSGYVGGQGGGQNGGNGGMRGMGGMGGGGWQVPPSQLFIIRKTPCGDQVTIDVDLVQAIRDPRSRPLVQAGDILILQPKLEEDLVNFGMVTFFSYGIGKMLRN